MTASSPIFRHIEIGRGQTVVLGEPFAHHAISVASGLNERELLPGTFGGAESIVIEVTPPGRVRGMRFRYAPATTTKLAMKDYNRMLKGYERMLGRPSVRDPLKAVWEDPATRFELWIDGSSVPAVLQSRLLDRQLSG